MLAVYSVYYILTAHALYVGPKTHHSSFDDD